MAGMMADKPTRRQTDRHTGGVRVKRQERDWMNLQGYANDHDHVPFSLNTMIELIDVKSQDHHFIWYKHAEADRQTERQTKRERNKEKI